jgi:hypothetical protein
MCCADLAQTSLQSVQEVRGSAALNFLLQPDLISD